MELEMEAFTTQEATTAANFTANFTSSDSNCKLDTQQAHYALYMSCSCLSLLVCVAAFIIYIAIRKKMFFSSTAQPDRDTTKHWIHFNFILSFIIRDLITITTLSLIAAEFKFTTLHARNQTRLAFHVYGIIANFYWMFLEGVWLFLGVSFPNNFKQYTHMKIKTCVVGWLTPAVLVSIWTVLESLHPHPEWENHFHEAPGMICIFVPIFVILFLNLVMMIKVLHHLKKMLNVVKSERQKTYRLVRATVLLSFLLGINFIVSVSVIPVLSKARPCIFQIVRLLNGPMIAFQGFFVAVYYVLRNEEIWETLKRRIPKTLFKRDSRSGSQQSRSGSGSGFLSIFNALTVSTRIKSHTSDQNGNTYQPCKTDSESAEPDNFIHHVDSNV